jgi:3-isopropylmalate/(R)-2-methylmalate dehydratase small subunit
MTSDSRILRVSGRGVPVPGDDVDTDRIMPARYLKCVTFAELGQYVFRDERFDPAGAPKPHPLNDPKFRGASILVVNKNFGCGSSREHAPQGILRSGIKAVLAESFAEIFAGNCAAIGLPAMTASESDVRALQEHLSVHPEAEVTVDLEAKRVTCGSGSFAADMRESYRKVFLDGTWDSTATLMAAADKVRDTAARLPYLAFQRRPEGR